MLLKQSTARDVMVLMVDSSDHIAGKTGLTLTITASKNGGAFASITPTVTERGNGWYSLALTTSHTDTLGDFALHLTGTGADATDKTWQVLTLLPGDAVTVQSGTGTGQISVTSGVVASNMTQIDGLATSGNNATLNLKQLNVVNSAGTAIVATSSGSNGHGASFTGNGTGSGIRSHSDSGNGGHFSTTGSGKGLLLDGGTGNTGLYVVGGTTAGHAAIFEARGGIVPNHAIKLIATNNGSGLHSTGDGTGAGATITGGSTGNGLELRSTAGTAFSAIGDTGALLDSSSANGSGLIVNGRGTEPAINASGGATGDGITVVGGNGVDIRANITGDLSGSIGSLGTGAITTGTIDASALNEIRNIFLVVNDSLNAPTVGTNTVTLSGSYGANNDALNGLLLGHFNAANELIQVRTVTDYDNTTFTVTVDKPWSINPVDTDRIRIYEHAQGNARINVRKNVALSGFGFTMYDSTTHAPATGLTVTAQRSIDGAAFAACTNAVSEVSAGGYKIDLSASDLNGDVIKLKFTATGADQQDITLVTQE